MAPDTTALHRQSGHFPKTLWGAILQAKKKGRSPKQLDALIGQYWTPVYKYIRLGWHRSHEDAKDLTQSFFASLFERDFLKDVSPDKGTFRSYLKACLKHFLMAAERDASRLKRGGNRRVIPLDFAAFEGALELACAAPTPEAAFDREWRDCVVRQALGRAESLLRGNGKSEYYQVLRAHDIDPDRAAPTSYKSVADRLGLTVTQVRKHLAYARRLLRSEVENLIREYADSEQSVRAELDSFFQSDL